MGVYSTYYGLKGNIASSRHLELTTNEVTDVAIFRAKLGTGLLSGKYSKPPVNEVDESFSIRPTMFKALIGKGHPEFCTKSQQDAQEFFLHVISTVQVKQ